DRSVLQDTSINRADQDLAKYQQLESLKSQEAYDEWLQKNPNARLQPGFSPSYADAVSGARQRAIASGNRARLYQQAPQLTNQQMTTGVDYNAGVTTGVNRNVDSSGMAITETATAEPIPGFMSAAFGAGGSKNKAI